MTEQKTDSQEQTLVTLGKLGGAYGIKGWLKVSSYTDVPEDILAYSPWQVKTGSEWREIHVEQGRTHGKGLVVKLQDIDDRNAAELLKNCDIAVDEQQLPDLDGDDYYWRDLIGLSVVTDKGYNLGEVTSLMETGSNDVLVVKANARDAFGQKERLIPFILDQVVLTVDRAARQITVNWDPSF